jgi:hypothetical protein
MDVLVSPDGSTFVSVKSSQAAWVDIEGDEAHSNHSYAKSYDIGSIVDPVRYIRIDGTTTNMNPGQTTGFYLDAIGAINYSVPTPPVVPIPGTIVLFSFGLAGLAGIRRRIGKR